MPTKFELTKEINSYKKRIKQLQQEFLQERDKEIAQLKLKEMRRLSERVVLLQTEVRTMK